MMVPILIGGAVVTGLYGVVKGALGAKDHSKASELNDSATSIVDVANRGVEEQRKATNAMLQDYGARKLRAFNGTIADFLEAFGRLKNVELVGTPELDRLNDGDFSTTTLQGLRDDYALLKSSGLGLGSGLTGGAAMAFGAYNGTMLLATASTGTAISTLSGAAATNATLAWLGGGSLAAGGGGMAMGAMVLGGLVAGPALAIFGHIVGNKGEEALNNARSNMEQAKVVKEQAAVMCGKLEAVERVTSLANTTFSKISSKLRHGVRDLNGVIGSSGEDYAMYSDEAKAVVFRSVKFAQLLKAMIDTPILDKEGNLVLSTEKRVEEIVGLMA
ncbi:hypothetical protein BBJ41_35415 [Burkholderia stabilis]|nr:hypothetical protein BBJ41_35415 [Burkholderia stabilis]HDR9495836.1 hypothetical protein [Burkholderia stabilis]HDR9527377.1 hypothetical protein [Burkholderia stabilis]HDR9542467.1 hypothetical protein [Burkholderia stabilis]HDR9580911.1 hypothetical protein [Burkholderia stabilis]